MKKVSGKTHTQKQLDDWSNQNNPNKKAYKANKDNHSNQMNPNHKVGHRRFLAFDIFGKSFLKGRTAYLPHGGCQYLCGGCGGYRDEYLRLRKANTDTSWLEVRDCGHKPFNSAVMWII